jgi:hypothetical protein
MQHRQLLNGLEPRCLLAAGMELLRQSGLALPNHVHSAI